MGVMSGGEMADGADDASSAGCRCDFSHGGRVPFETVFAVLGLGLVVRRRRLIKRKAKA